MRGNELLDKMGLIDPKYVEEADAKPYKSKATFVKYAATAACICLAVVSAFMMRDMLNTHDGITDDGSARESGSIVEITLDIDNQVTNRTNELVTEPAIDPTTNNDNDVFLPYMPSNGPSSNEEIDITPLICGFGESTYDADMCVNNGTVVLSDSLKAAMEHYGKGVKYRVLVDIFEDSVRVSSGSQLAIKESQRLSELGYETVMETVWQTEENSEYVTTYITYYFYVHATLEQIESFAADDSLGYSLLLHNEYFGDTETEQTVVFNSAN